MKRPFVVLLLATTLAGLGCGARTTETTDGQSHWLTACDVDAECGSAACVCGVCTAECTEDADCWAAGGAITSRCAENESLDCEGLPATGGLCVPDCTGDACISSEVETTETGVSATQLSFDTSGVPACPTVAARVGLPLATMLSETGDYDGPVTVDGIATTAGSTRVTLVYNALAGGSATLIFNSSDGKLVQGVRYEAVARVGDSGSGEYAFIALRDAGGALHLAVANGADTLYQSGLFRTDVFGATLDLRMQCQEAVDDGCFENQVQAVYEGIFTADNEVVTQGAQYETLNIDGRGYTLSFTSSSVDGGAPLCDGFDIGRRNIQFALIAE